LFDLVAYILNVVGLKVGKKLEGNEFHIISYKTVQSG
jgi:hypothetical protein